MKKMLLSALLATSIVSTAAAQQTPTSSPLKVTNDGKFPIDCRVYWGSTVKVFSRVLPGTVSTQTIVRSLTERTARCVVSDKPVTSQYLSNTLKFYTSDYADYDIVCTSTIYESSPQLKCALNKTAL